MFQSSLFQQSSVSDFFRDVRKKMIKEIDQVPAEDIVAADVEKLSAQFLEKYQATCPVLSDDISYDEPEFSQGSDRIIVAVYVPFVGDHRLFHCTGGSSPVIKEQIQVQPTQLIIPMQVERGRVGELQQKVSAILKRIRDEGLGPVRYQVEHSNPELKRWALERIQQRQADLADHARALEELRRSGFAVRRRNDGTEKVIVPVKPKVIILQPKPSPASPEPELALADYDEILDAIGAMANVYERSPSAFKAMDEEHLRTILLVGLNGIFKGQATGETFNGEGKTDILIRVNDKNVFIAECLFWDGPEKFRKKLTEQLFRYSTWRDSKLAAIVFNRKKGFTEVVQKMKEVVAGLENRLAEMPYSAASGCRYRFRRQDDAAKQFILTCLAFEVPS
jgi:hypothetical protein